MARKPLTPEEIAALQSSPYIAYIASDRISFTPEFKKLMYDELTSGKTIRTILAEHCIDPAILGDRRIWNIASKLRAEAAREEGFEDLRSGNSRRSANETPEQALSARVEQLEHALAYTLQEVEFLKKLQAADTEARKSWGSKQPRK